MRIESSVTSVSWIPLGATEGFARLAFGLLRVAHYDPPPPEPLGDVDELVGAGRARFANRLEAWIEVQDGRVVDAGQRGGGRSGPTPRSGRRGRGSPRAPAVSWASPHPAGCATSPTSRSRRRSPGPPWP